MSISKHALSRARFYRNGRPGAVLREFLIDGNFVRLWMPRLRGRYVKLDKGQHEAREAAVTEARAFRDYCRMLLAKRTLHRQERDK